MDPFHLKFHDFATNKIPEIHISELSDFRKIGPYNDAERYRRNIRGPNFQKHPLFQFMGFWFLNLRSWYQDLGTKIFGGTGPGVTGEPSSRRPLTDILSLL